MRCEPGPWLCCLSVTEHGNLLLPRSPGIFSALSVVDQGEEGGMSDIPEHRYVRGREGRG